MALRITNKLITSFQEEEEEEGGLTHLTYYLTGRLLYELH